MEIEVNGPLTQTSFSPEKSPKCGGFSREGVRLVLPIHSDATFQCQAQHMLNREPGFVEVRRTGF